MIRKMSKLNKGDMIGFVSPCYKAEHHKYQKAYTTLENLGYITKISKYLYSDSLSYAATVEERSLDINQMVTDSNVKMILFGGGNVGNELLPYLDYETIRKNPKLFLSYSGGTSILNIIYMQTGMITYYGQRPGTFFDLKEHNKSYFEAVFNFDKYLPFNYQVLHQGESLGILIGGYLEEFIKILSNQLFDSKENNSYILFLEEYEEFYSEDAVISMLAVIEQSKLMQNINGIIFGHYSNQENIAINNRLMMIGETYSIPIMKTNDFGHGLHHGILPIGKQAKITTSKKRLDIF